jgi:hypothetical protein
MNREGRLHGVFKLPPQNLAAGRLRKPTKIQPGQTVYRSRLYKSVSQIRSTNVNHNTVTLAKDDEDDEDGEDDDHNDDKEEEVTTKKVKMALNVIHHR